ncbi:hypothetical protein CPAST_c15700 [Clostridium pasteurianum DSM 525 = ATCC 6013]|jgi:hypothetical protein|uniref:Uncharacterized protein n=1 Tax=Clostridium pasteurianum DSM 525 = ATCC 6013 TaxID=1262449 RepID=A0A0H3J964_CLOPA|nr:hypothetical protein CPAST_c15700 [Clostridium pasteurianum DSM 525 = ATCC 6013]AJA51633.1 hypothetical protein CLPA_c15700 [Clostridium pasteurianum DSM 525 = ATCC 6013]KRU12360.1 hypothetical protein CP6013_01607 [Clostridium pasteurianum DSM 525 = ATCC 6013]
MSKRRNSANNTDNNENTLESQSDYEKNRQEKTKKHK